MKKRFLLSCLLALTITISYTQISWPSITPVTKPWTRWWWLGSAVNPKDITANMEQYKSAGLGGLEITPIYGVQGDENHFVEYLSPQWMKLFTHTLKEAKRLNLQIDMATGTGWPFGGGPLIGEKDACKDFVYKTYTVKEGEQLNEPVTYIQEPFVRAVGKQPDINTLIEPVYNNKNLQQLALDQVKFKKRLPLQTLMAYSEDSTIDLTAKVDTAGKLNWKPSKGNWTLYAIFMGWHGKMVERAAPGGEGNAIDHFSAPALKKYLGRFDKAFAGYDISYLRGFFNDSYEVDDARGQSNWTPDFLNGFKRLRGYDLRVHLPQLLQKTNTEASLRILHDYRLTISDLLLENFTKPWHTWSKAKGKLVRNQSHGSPANILDLYAAIDIPETEGKELLRYKFATSAAHVTGKPLASAEAATWLNDHFKSSLSDVKTIVDNYFIGGVNHIVYHGTAYSPMNEPWPGWLFYAAVHFQPTNPFWKDIGALNNYVARCQSFLQSGKPDNDVLIYFPFHDKISEPDRDLLFHFDGVKGFENSSFKTVSEHMLNTGYAFDFISDRQLQNTQVSGSRLQTGGTSYQTLVLPDIKYMPVSTLKKIVQLVHDGATVIIYKNWPVQAPGNSFEEKVSVDRILTNIPFNTSADNTQKAKLGKGLFILSDNIDQLLTSAKIRKESMMEQGLSFIRRKYAHGDYYFVVNNNNKPFNSWIELKTKAVSAVLFNPMTEQAGLTKCTTLQDGSAQVYLYLLPGESVIIQTSDKKIEGKQYPFYTMIDLSQLIQGNWNLQFMEGGPSLPASTQITELSSWTSLPDPAAAKFSGTAKYSIHFPKQPVSASAFLLNLGKVAETAEVFLNGKKIATLIGPQYQVLIPSDRFTDDNVLEILVTNSMVNRIIDLEKSGVKWKKFYNVNFPAYVAENRGSDGLFTTAKWQPEESGLLGPVTLNSVNYGPLMLIEVYLIK